jgi:hypothetical protein
MAAKRAATPRELRSKHSPRRLRRCDDGLEQARKVSERDHHR